MSCFSKLGYSTVKTVKIYDPLLATLHYSFMISIFIYIAVIQVVRNLGYLSFEPPIGSSRLSIQPPMGATHNDPDDPGYEYAFTPASSLPYCSSYVPNTGSNTTKAKTQKDCVYMGAMEANFPVTGGSPFYISTRIRESNQTLYCREPSSSNDYVCDATYKYACYDSFELDTNGCKVDEVNHPNSNCWGNEKYQECWAQRSYFVPDIEKFTLLLDHAVRTNNGVSADSSEMTGVLEYCNGTTITPDETDEGQGFFTVESLLQAASKEDNTCGLALDGPSVVASSTKSARYDGLVLQIEIEYKNTAQWTGAYAIGTIDYTMRTSVVNGTKSKIEEQFWFSYPDKRITRDRHGIKIVVVQSGELGAFSMTALLTTLTSSLALLAVATTGVDFLAMYVLARKHVYKNAKYELINEKYLEEKEQEEARVERENSRRWDYEPPNTNGGDGGDDTGSESFISSKVAPSNGGSGAVNQFEWS